MICNAAHHFPREWMNAKCRNLLMSDPLVMPPMPSRPFSEPPLKLCGSPAASNILYYTRLKTDEARIPKKERKKGQKRQPLFSLSCLYLVLCGSKARLPKLLFILPGKKCFCSLWPLLTQEMLDFIKWDGPHLSNDFPSIYKSADRWPPVFHGKKTAYFCSFKSYYRVCLTCHP